MTTFMCEYVCVLFSNMSNYVVLRKLETGYSICTCERLYYPTDVQDLAVLACVNTEHACSYLRASLNKQFKLMENMDASVQAQLVSSFIHDGKFFMKHIDPIVTKSILLSLQRSIRDDLHSIQEKLNELPKSAVYAMIHLFSASDGVGLLGDDCNSDHTIAIEYFPQEYNKMALEHISIELKLKHRSRFGKWGIHSGTLFPRPNPPTSDDPVVRDFKAAADEFRSKYIK